jgi:phosphoribosylformylglycinamidine cyclo-ligase
MLPAGLAAVIDTGGWTIPPLFEVLRRLGRIPDDDYRRTFNLGVGIVLAVPARAAAKAERILQRVGDSPFRVGEVTEQRRGRPRVEYR